MEKQFAEFAREKANQLAPGVDLDQPPESPDAVERGEWELLHPQNYYVRMERASKLMDAKKWAEAKPLLESLAEAYHGESKADNPLWLLAVTERNLGDTNAELATLQKFALQESDLTELYVRLIELSEAQKDWPAVTKYADRLLAINPLIALPHRALAEAGVALNQPGQAITAYRKLLLLDPPDPVDAHFQLARLLHAQGGAGDEAKRNVLQALEDAPRYLDAQRLLLEMNSQNPQPSPGAPASKPATTP
jgi:tetratricopeptide (TPR) repeat protein